MNRPEHIDNHYRNSECYSDPTAYRALVSAEKSNYPRVYICSPFRGNVGLNTLMTLKILPVYPAEPLLSDSAANLASPIHG
jgi:hypothetical protein